jgi:NADH dehydrogenase
VRALVSPGERSRSVEPAAAVAGDLRAPETLGEALRGASAVVSACDLEREDRSAGLTYAAIFADGHRNLAEAARAEGVRRLVLVSSLAAEPEAHSDELRMRAAGEQAARSSGVECVVLAAGMLFGPGTALERMLRRWAEGRWPVTLVPGQGSTEIQPISAGDVALAAVRALGGEIPPGRQELAGEERYALMELIELALAAARRSPLRLHVPSAALSAAGPLLDRLPRGALPDSRELALLRGRWTSSARASALVGRKPESVAEWIAGAFARRP